MGSLQNDAAYSHSTKNISWFYSDYNCLDKNGIYMSNDSTKRDSVSAKNCHWKLGQQSVWTILAYLETTA